MTLDICNAENPLDRILELVKGLLGDKDKVKIEDSKNKLGKLHDALWKARVRLHLEMNGVIVYIDNADTMEISLDQDFKAYKEKQKKETV